VKVKTVDRDLIELLLRFVLHSPHLLSKRKVRLITVNETSPSLRETGMGKKLSFGIQGWKKTDFTFY
jgi:hypothetical protein